MEEEKINHILEIANSISLSDKEMEKIIDVMKRDDKIRQREKNKSDVIKQKIFSIEVNAGNIDEKDLKERCFCCRAIFGWIFNRPLICPKCEKSICLDCKRLVDAAKWMCILCFTKLELNKITGEWQTPELPTLGKSEDTQDVIYDSEGDTENAFKIIDENTKLGKYLPHDESNIVNNAENTLFSSNTTDNSSDDYIDISYESLDLNSIDSGYSNDNNNQQHPKKFDYDSSQSTQSYELLERKNSFEMLIEEPLNRQCKQRQSIQRSCSDNKKDYSKFPISKLPDIVPMQHKKRGKLEKCNSDVTLKCTSLPYMAIENNIKQQYKELGKQDIVDETENNQMSSLKRTLLKAKNSLRLTLKNSFSKSKQKSSCENEDSLVLSCSVDTTNTKSVKDLSKMFESNSNHSKTDYFNNNIEPIIPTDTSYLQQNNQSKNCKNIDAEINCIDSHSTYFDFIDNEEKGFSKESFSNTSLDSLTNVSDDDLNNSCDITHEGLIKNIINSIGMEKKNFASRYIPIRTRSSSLDSLLDDIYESTSASPEHEESCEDIYSVDLDKNKSDITYTPCEYTLLKGESVASINNLTSEKENDINPLSSYKSDLFCPSCKNNQLICRCGDFSNKTEEFRHIMCNSELTLNYSSDDFSGTESENYFKSRRLYNLMNPKKKRQRLFKARQNIPSKLSHSKSENELSHTNFDSTNSAESQKLLSKRKRFVRQYSVNNCIFQTTSMGTYNEVSIDRAIENNEYENRKLDSSSKIKDFFISDLKKNQMNSNSINTLEKQLQRIKSALNFALYLLSDPEITHLSDSTLDICNHFIYGS